mmetsp:Transcript_36154/g.113484  ORF Transcript_36154/g.113484 Transcript_36154/m.113484 type:complete len:327 (-) Transcript_36154:89-1069(-)
MVDWTWWWDLLSLFLPPCARYLGACPGIMWSALRSLGHLVHAGSVCRWDDVHAALRSDPRRWALVFVAQNYAFLELLVLLLLLFVCNNALHVRGFEYMTRVDTCIDVLSDDAAGEASRGDWAFSFFAHHVCWGRQGQPDYNCRTYSDFAGDDLSDLSLAAVARDEFELTAARLSACSFLLVTLFGVAFRMSLSRDPAGRFGLGRPALNLLLAGMSALTAAVSYRTVGAMTAATAMGLDNDIIVPDGVYCLQRRDFHVGYSSGAHTAVLIISLLQGLYYATSAGCICAWSWGCASSQPIAAVYRSTHKATRPVRRWLATRCPARRAI